MRALILALAVVLGTANTLPTLDEEIEALVTEGKVDEAYDLARAAAKRGDADAQDWLGWFHETGKGRKVDLKKAAEHYRKAADAGDNHAAWRLGVLIDSGKVPGRLEDAVALFQAAADRNFPAAHVSLAVMQATGRGTPKDHTAAMANYLAAAKLGHPHGVRGVGIMFYLGEGVTKDVVEAAAWFLASAAMGNEEAEQSLQSIADEVPPGNGRAIVERAKAIAAELGAEVDITFEEDPPAS
ncbi:tetratricopeptide repeat protein [Erythrobacter oryzae]|uniref:tetratricopeptide repeat protein n=1 Tax=Erythrobacter oryzae TaxID=3019556 RepID=UPI002554338B|nr:tetratricopeptide repeat protein [Erythrobacter sp. COR-2]